VADEAAIEPRPDTIQAVPFLAAPRRHGFAMNLVRCLLLIACWAAGAFAAGGPIKRIDIYVTPYYEAAKAPGGTPKVAVGKTYDTLLASNSRDDIVHARDEINRNNSLVTPMTMMVLAIRLYDVGLRDDAVFWFYAAKDRFVTLAGVSDIKSRELVQVEDAVKNFAILAGPVINGYAFCDFAKQQKVRQKALKWVVDNPYRAMFLPQVPALPGDREQNLTKAVAQATEAAAKEREYLAKPANVAELKAKRQQNDADTMFCWK
jgi:hypothetical protein